MTGPPSSTPETTMLRRLAIAAAFAGGSNAFAYQQGFNCGGTNTRTMGDGAVYTKDRAYTQSNGSGYVGGEAVQPDLLARLNPLGGIVPGVQARNIVSSRRVGWQEYRFDLPPGSYLVSFHFMEWSQHWSGVRVFDIEVEGEVLFDGFDIFTEVDRLYALNLRRVVDVDDGSLSIIARAIEEEPLLAAVHVESVVDDGIPPAVPEDVAVVPGYSENVLTWATDYDRDQLGVAVLRSIDGGPEEVITPDPVVATRYVDTGLEPDRDYAYRLVAVDAAGNTSVPSAVASGIPLSSDQSDLVVYGFEMAQEDLIWLNTHRQSDDYLPGLFWTLDDSWPDARVRYRGNTSRSNVKKNHKIRVDSPLPSGHDVLNLQAHWFDPSMMREALSYQVMARSGVTSSIAEYVHLERNGEFIGVYQSAEQVDEHFLENRSLDGSVWKGIDATFIRRNNIDSYYGDYKLEVGSYGDFEYLSDLVDVVALTSDEEFRTEIKKHLDVAKFIDYYGGNAVFSGWDIAGWNLYLFRDASTGLFEFLPWDLDGSWEMENVGQPIDIATSDHPVLLFFWNRLYDRMTTVPQYRRMLAVRLQELIEGPVDGPTLVGMIRSDHALIRPDVERDKTKLGWEDMGPFDDEKEVLETFVERRGARLYEQLETFAPDPSVNLFINEALLWNLSGIVDEAGEPEPWLEIYNFGNESIDLGGMWLSDDPADRMKWALPLGETLEAESHLLVWLDGEPAEGPLHSGFRVGTETEELILSQTDGAAVDRFGLDTISLPDLAAARVEDAAHRVHLAAKSTPGARNDSTPVVEVRIDVDPEYFLGDQVTFRVSVENRRSFPRTIDMALTIRGDPGEIELGRGTIVLAGDATVVVPISRMLPTGIDPIVVTLIASVEDELGRPIHEVEAVVALRDPRAPDLVVNEIMASNDTTIADEGDDFDDWVEIYNAGTHTVHLDGLFLSDDAAEPRKWRLPDEELPPGAYRIVWCDDDTEQGWTHAPFKLSKSGEEVGIFDLDLRENTAVDIVPFGPQVSDVSEGRSPDGSPSWVVLPYATPGDANP